MTDRNDRPAWPEAIYGVALPALGFGLHWLQSRRFLVPEFYSIAADGGLRMLQGRVPYKDFLTVSTPGLFWLQARFFAALGANYGAYVVMGGVLKALAVLCVLAFCRKAGGGAGAALLTALWSSGADSGALFYNSAALFFLFPIAAAISREPGWDLAAGALAGCSFFFKQTIGASAAYFFALHFLARGEKTRAMRFSGAAAAAILLGLIRIGAGSWEEWLRPSGSPYSLWLPLWAALLIAAAAGGGKKALAASAGVIAAFSLVLDRRFSLFTYLPLAALLFVRDPENWALLAALTLTQHMSALFSLSADREFPALLGLQAFLVWRDLKPSRRSTRLAFAALTLLGLFKLGAWGLLLGHPPAGRALGLAGMTGVWADVETADPLEQADAYLRARGPAALPFFTDSYAGILNARFGQAAPQPFLWLERGVTFQSAEDEDRFCSALQAHGVRTIILAKPGELGIACFSRLLGEDFVPDGETPGLTFYRRR